MRLVSRGHLHVLAGLYQATLCTTAVVLLACDHWQGMVRLSLMHQPCSRASRQWVQQGLGRSWAAWPTRQIQQQLTWLWMLMLPSTSSSQGVPLAPAAGA